MNRPGGDASLGLAAVVVKTGLLGEGGNAGPTIAAVTRFPLGELATAPRRPGYAASFGATGPPPGEGSPLIEPKGGRRCEFLIRLAGFGGRRPTMNANSAQFRYEGFCPIGRAGRGFSGWGFWGGSSPRAGRSGWSFHLSGVDWSHPRRRHRWGLAGAALRQAANWGPPGAAGPARTRSTAGPASALCPNRGTCTSSTTAKVMGTCRSRPGATPRVQWGVSPDAHLRGHARRAAATDWA